MPITIFIEGSMVFWNKAVYGYGIPGLVNNARRAPWEKAFPNGRNFKGIVVGNKVLCNKTDVFLPIKWKVTIKELPDVDEFFVEGFHTSDFCMDLRDCSLIEIFPGKKLLDLTLPELNEEKNKDLAAYKITFEKMN